jgi:hypothetical protein
VPPNIYLHNSTAVRLVFIFSHLPCSSSGKNTGLNHINFWFYSYSRHPPVLEEQIKIPKIGWQGTHTGTERCKCGRCRCGRCRHGGSAKQSPLSRPTHGSSGTGIRFPHQNNFPPGVAGKICYSHLSTWCVGGLVPFMINITHLRTSRWLLPAATAVR